MSAELAVAVCEGPVKALRPVGQRTAALCKWLWEEPARAVVSGTVLALWTSFHVTMLARTTRFALQPCSVPLQTWQTVEGVTGLTFSAAVTFLAFLAARTDGLLTPYGDRGEDAPTSHVLLGLGTFLLFLARLGNFIAGNALVFSSSTSSCPAASGELWRLSLAFITVNYVVFAVLLAARSLARQFSIQVLAASASATDAIPSWKPSESVAETVARRQRARRAQKLAVPYRLAIPALFLTSGAVALLAVLGMQLLCFFEAACFAATNPAVDDVTSAAIVPCGLVLLTVVAPVGLLGAAWTNQTLSAAHALLSGAAGLSLTVLSIVLFADAANEAGPHAAAEWARLNNSQRSLFPGGQSEIEDAFAATTGRIAGMALAQGVACLVSSLTGFVLALRIARNV